jgi:hypothetical protein
MAALNQSYVFFHFHTKSTDCIEIDFASQHKLKLVRPQELCIRDFLSGNAPLKGDQFIVMHDGVLPSEIVQSSLLALTKERNKKGNEEIIAG